MADIGRKTDTWGTKFGFIMAAVGSSVGLGNFWRFPYTAGENGGSAFIFIYILCVLAIGVPLLMAEYSMGRKAGMSSIEGVLSLARAEGKSGYWGIVGWLGAITSFLILSFYMVISAWLLAFFLQTQSFAGMNAEASENNFVETIGNVNLMLTLLFVFIAANVVVVGRGIKGGIEKAASILMPLFFVMLVLVVVFALTQGNAAAAVKFLLTPEPSAFLNFETYLNALGQAFFSIGVGICLMITYGAYLQKDTNIPRSSAIIAGSDTLVAIIAGFAIFPIVFAADLDPAAGPGLFFVSMPVAFGQLGGMGTIFATVFFALAIFAAFTSSISLLEVAVSWFEERQGVTRFGAATGIGFLLFIFGAAYVYSTAYLDFVDFVTGTIMLPLGGLLVAVFCGWVLSRDMLEGELQGGDNVVNLFRFSMRWITPIFIGIVLVFGLIGSFTS